MYGGSPKRRSKSRASKKWQTDIQRSMITEEKRKQREDNKFVKMQSDLDLRRAVRRKLGKFYDTESMMFTQAKIDRHNQAVEARRLQEEVDARLAAQLLKWFLIFFGACLLATSLWWLYVLYIAILFTRMKRRNSHIPLDNFVPHKE